MNKLAPIVLAAALVVSSCGGDDDTTSAAPATNDCPTSSGEDVSIDVQWTGPWEQPRARALFAEWDDRQDDVTVDLRDADGFLEVPLALMSDDPPIVAAVSYAALPALVGAGAVRAMGDCLTEAGVAFDAMLPEAVGMADVDGARYGAPAMVGSALLLYDRAAFERAGIEGPPATLAEVHDDAVALRDNAGFESPVAWSAAQLALLGLELGSDDARDAAAQWVALAQDGLLAVDADTEPLPAIGAGRAAMEVVELPLLADYAAAIASGQAPDADLGISPLPGLRSAVAPVGGNVWVVSAESTPDQTAAAVRFITWLSGPGQQARLSALADGVPADPIAINEPVLIDRSRQLPLFDDAWTAITDHPLLLRQWTGVMGSFTTIPRLLRQMVESDGSFDETWTTIVDLSAAAAAAQEQDAEAYFRCIAAHAQDFGSPIQACT